MGSGSSDALVSRVARAAREPGSRRTLLLDLDGTLAPIAPTPEEARVPAETVEALRELARAGWRVAVISGRSLADLASKIDGKGFRLFGSHGLEDSADAGGRSRLSPGTGERLRALAASAADLERSFPGARVEVKTFGVAFHDRGLRGRSLFAWRREVRALLDAGDLRGLAILAGKRVLEVRPAEAEKGRVAEALLAGRAPRGIDESLVAIGDDRTDEDLFAALSGRGLTIRVGRASRRTAAGSRLPSPRAVGRFLSGLAVRAGKGASGRKGPRGGRP